MEIYFLSRSASFPGGNQVDGLPPAPSNATGGKGPGLENIDNLKNMVISSMLEMRRAPRQAFQSTRPFVRIKIIHVSIDLQTRVEIPERNFENELDKDPKIRPVYRAALPADRPCAGITLRVQAYSACSTSHSRIIAWGRR